MLNLTDKIMMRMKYLQDTDERDRMDGTGRLQRLRQITRDTGKFIALLASICPGNGDIIEIGTSGGYSALWLSLAAKEKNMRIRTFEVLPEKISIAKETFRIAAVEDHVELIQGDFLELAGNLGDVSFCFLDAEKEIYPDCFTAVAGKIVKNGLFVADNAINHYETVKPMIETATADSRFDCIVVPVGKGVFLCRRNHT